MTYDGAEAIGGRADLYLLAPTGRDGNHTEAAHNLYTQGPAAARSATEPDAQPADIANKVANDLARADSATTGAAGSAQAIGVRRLLGGEQAPKLQVGAVPVVDLRGDPGGWLPRVLLALQSQAAVLVCDVDSHDRSPDPAPRSDVDGRGWVEAHLRAHWRLTPADRATDGASSGINDSSTRGARLSHCAAARVTSSTRRGAGTVMVRRTSPRDSSRAKVRNAQHSDSLRTNSWTRCRTLVA